MSAELGQLALCLALALSLVQVVAGFRGAITVNARYMAMSRGAALGTFVFTTLAFGALMFAYIVSDFTVLAVVQNSHTAKPLLYKITGVWANHEGSMLLWVLILTIYSAAIALTDAGGQRLNARTLGVQGLVAIAFILFILLTSNPFARVLLPPFEGTGLNPLLQDPGLAFHPPLLYAGYVGLSATFSFAVAALLEARNDAHWVRAARPFALIAWVALTLGIAAGSWWAYYTLGWGGFWFWDPVENASLMPWLVTTALFHSMMATERSGAFKSWTMLLAIAAFSFSLIGTFLVRSGVLNSVHAFANDPERGLFILLILALAVGLPLAFFALRAPHLTPGAPFEPASRETGILLNNLFLTVAAGTIMFGTLYPLILDALQGAKISVGPPYFVTIFVPLMVMLAMLMPFGPLIVWRRADLRAAAWSLRWAGAAALVALLVALALIEPRSVLGLLAAGFSVWLVGGAITDLLRRAGHWRYLHTLSMSAWAVAMAHAGMGVVALGVAGATVWRSEAADVVAPGETLSIAGYELRFEGVERVPGPNFIADRAEIVLSKNGTEIATIYPEKRQFLSDGTVTTNSSIRTNGFADLYVILGDPRENGAWVISAYYSPMAPFIWMGAVIMACGGLFGFAVRIRRARASASAAPTHAAKPVKGAIA
ncbi:MAG: heme lyase CcmF/NrfE family subunit [Micropepsaceae bacterium]